MYILRIIKIHFKELTLALNLSVGTPATTSFTLTPEHAANIVQQITILAWSTACRKILIPTAMTAFVPISILKLA